MIIDQKLKKIMLEDIERCKEAQENAEGTHKLFQILISKYDGIFDNFREGVQTSGKIAPAGQPFDFRSELSAIAEKLEILLTVNENRIRQEDPLYEFKKQFEKDTEKTKQIIDNIDGIGEEEIKEFYNTLIAKYSKIIPNFSDNIDGYRRSDGYFFPIEGFSLQKNIKNIYEKMQICISLNYINIKFEDNISSPLLQINNNNQNVMNVELTFEQLKDKVENITSVNDEEIDEILEKINELEKICNSSDRKTKKWENAKKIIVWLIDKGIDVAIQLIPSIISKFS